MEVIKRSERQRQDLANLERLYAKTTRGLNVRDYLNRQYEIYHGWCSTAMSCYLRKYSPEAGTNLNRELEEVSMDLEFIKGIFPEFEDEVEALRVAIRKCRAYHRQWLTNTYSLRRKTCVPKKLLC